MAKDELMEAVMQKECAKQIMRAAGVLHTTLNDRRILDVGKPNPQEKTFLTKPTDTQRLAAEVSEHMTNSGLGKAMADLDAHMRNMVVKHHLPEELLAPLDTGKCAKPKEVRAK